MDRFQIWFGKPIWKKTVNGVQYGLGSIPFGGFVSLPQMAPMESIEGKTIKEDEKPMEPAKPLDKIIVAFAGPLFSFLLAVACAVVVSKMGLLHPPGGSLEIGYVNPDSPAEKAGILPGDKILEIAGEKPVAFTGKFDAVTTMIAISSGDKIEMKLERDGKEITVHSGYEIPEKKNALERKGLRTIGIAPKENVYIAYLMPHSPAVEAGLKLNDRIVAVNDVEIVSFFQVIDLTKDASAPIKYTYEREGKIDSVMIQPRTPDLPEGYEKKLIGFVHRSYLPQEVSTVYPSVGAQLEEAVVFMWKSIKAIADRKTIVGLEHMSGPVGMGTSMFTILKNAGVSELLWFLVIINVNLAILNLLPFPVLDGGHIVMSIYEFMARRIMPLKFLEVVQTACVLLIMSMFLYITMKDGLDLMKPKVEPAKFLPKKS